MNDKQSEALMLADALMEDNKTSDCVKAAAELRRLHEAHDWQYKMAGDRLRRIEKLERVNAELLNVLKEAENALADYIPSLEKSGAMLGYGRSVLQQARAAIAKAEGES